MKIETPFIALILGSLLFGGLFTMFLSVADENNVTYDLSTFETQNGETKLKESFDRINQTKTEMDELTEDFFETSVEDTGSLFGYLKFTFKLGKQVFLNLNIFKDLFNITAELIGVDGQIIASFFIILLVVFVVSVIMILMGRVYS